jgi:cyanophycinase
VSGAVILGGGVQTTGTADALVDRLIALAGGPTALIVVIPTAGVTLQNLPAGGPLPANVDGIVRHVESRGAKRVVVLHTRDRDVANSEDFVKILRSAGGVLITGGAFGVLQDVYHGTLVERELKAVLSRGGVLAGDSAGAITLGCFWVGWDPATNVPIRVSDGLCVLPDVTVTPHIETFGDAKRITDVLKYLRAHPEIVGLNIHEETVLLLRGRIAEVFGKGSVSVLDASRDSTKAYLRLVAGDRHDLSK